MNYRRMIMFFLFLIFFIVPLYFVYNQFLNLKGIKSVEKPNVLLISVDTCQAGAVGAYGNPTVYTPFMDRFSQNGVLFPRAYAPVPTTGPSHTTLLTGQSPVTHRVFRNAMVYSNAHVSLATILRHHGYKTGAFVSGYALTARTCGLNTGFDIYNDYWSVSQLEQDAKEAYASCISWLENGEEGPFFAWLHLFDAHAPYQERRPFIDGIRSRESNFEQDKAYSDDQVRRYEKHAEKARQTGDFMVLVSNPMTTETDPETLYNMWTAYLSEVSYVDSVLNDLKRFLETDNRWDNTLVILTSDHGEGFDHDYYYAHGDRLWESAVHVPFIVRYPENRVSNRISRAIARLEDVFPTVLSILELQLPSEPTDGTDLQTAMELNLIGSNVLWSVLAPPLPRKNLSQGLVIAAYEPDYKLIRTLDRNENMLFNVTDDPGERNDLSRKNPDVKNRLSRHIDRILETSDIPRTVEFDPGEIREMESLRSLGYIQ
jgi:arylsulfatase A-like enzyme